MFPDDIEIVIGGLQVSFIMAQQKVLCGLPECLGYVHVVPVNEVGIPVRPFCPLTFFLVVPDFFERIVSLSPGRRIPMDFFREFQQPGFPCPVIEPYHTVQVVAPSYPLPVVGGRQQLFVRQVQLVAEVFGHEFQDALIIGMLVIRLQAVQHDHVGPEVECPVFARDHLGAEIADCLWLLTVY